jgi:hypothetical protein
MAVSDEMMWDQWYRNCQKKFTKPRKLGLWQNIRTKHEDKTKRQRRGFSLEKLSVLN